MTAPSEPDQRTPETGWTTVTHRILETLSDAPGTAREVSAELEYDYEVVCALMGQLAKRDLLDVVGLGWAEGKKPRLFQTSPKGKAYAGVA